MAYFFSDWTPEDVARHNARIKNTSPIIKKEVKDDKLISKEKKSKFRAIKTEYDGIKFDSKKEAERYADLKILEQAGRIENLQLQVKYELQPAFELLGKKIRAITYVADFVYFDKRTNETVVEDVKRDENTCIQAKEKDV